MNNKEYKKLTSQIRQDFNIKIQPHYIKNKCEICDSKSNLELHHNVPLSIVVLNLLKSDIDKKFYREYAMGIQINNGFTTLCHNCHRNHPDIKSTHGRMISRSLTKKYSKIRLETDITMKSKLLPFIEDNIGKKIFIDSDERGLLIKYCNLLDKQYRIISSYSQIKEYIDKNTEYTLLRDREYKKSNPERFRKTYWLLTKKEDINEQQS